MVFRIVKKIIFFPFTPSVTYIFYNEGGSYKKTLFTYRKLVIDIFTGGTK